MDNKRKKKLPQPKPQTLPTAKSLAKARAARPRAGNRQVNKTAGQPATPACKARARELYQELGPQWAEISRRLKDEKYRSCEPSTIANWAKREHWQAEDIATSADPAATAKLPHKAKREPQASVPLPPPADLGSYRTKKTNLENVRVAIEQVVLSISDARATQDLRAIGSLATALCKLIELEGKLSPATAAELAARAVELGLEPDQFVAALAEQWRIAKVG